MRLIIKTLIIALFIFIPARVEPQEKLNPMFLHPEWYINITDWSFYAPRSVAIIHHVTIENTSDITYKDIKVRVRYYSTSPSKSGTQIGQETGILPVTLPPHSKKTYLKGGTVFGAGSNSMNAGNIEVLGAELTLK